ncbi:metallophosphoesterase [Romboutsia ilealis]|uniref:metallophosphoesterase n=2 Tax=Romboutsia ilealis TaxID=1115758 RepID=UPI0025B77658|nr:metallophosphoesterase [Romboutsia ilealis]
MKIGILSDTHMIKECIDKAIPYLKNCGLIIHAGDNFSDSKYIHNITKVGVMAVKGNCDFDNVEDELIFDIEDKVIFLCHGDKYNVKYGLNEIEIKAKSINADIVIFGHTHIPLKFEKDNILYLNPGSISLPREVDYKSFFIMNLENDNIKIEQIRL